MSANVETMFSVRETPWHGLGEIIQEAPTSADAIKIAGLDWEVIPTPIYDNRGQEIEGYFMNQRSTDGANLGIVTGRYQICQNSEAFAFTDDLLGEGCVYETAGSLDGGKRVWMLAKLERTLLAEEDIDPYLVFTNCHDGKGSIRVAITPVRVVCQNTLNLALESASRHWSCVHKGDVASKLEEARNTLQNANAYMAALEEEFGELKLKKVSDQKVKEMTDMLVEATWPDMAKRIKEQEATLFGMSYRDRRAAMARMERTAQKLDDRRNEIIIRYNEAPDLRDTEKTAFRFINAVSDYVTHTDDHNNTATWRTSLFSKVVDGHKMIDTALEIAKAA